MNKQINSQVLDVEKMRQVLNEAIEHALRKHKQLGESVATLQDNTVIIVPPEYIPIKQAKPKHIKGESK